MANESTPGAYQLPATQTADPGRLPLDGLLVADFSRVLAGPLAASFLADLGATVIKVERPVVGDETRAWGPPWTENSSSYFEAANRSKKSMTLDLADPADLTLAKRLASLADVLLENFRPGSLDRRGLGYAQVSAANPGVVYCSISGFGRSRGADLPGYDFLVQAVGGLMSITGQPDHDPTKVGVALVDVLTSKDAVIGILAALEVRHRTGCGQWVQTNLLSSLLASLVNQAAGYLATGHPAERMGNRHPSIAPYETLRSRDDLLAVCCGNDGQFRRLTEVLGIAHLADDERFLTNAARVQHRGDLISALEEALARDSADSWVRRLTSADVPAGRVGTIADAFELADSLGLQPLVPIGPGVPAQVRHPISYSDTPVTKYGPPPSLGEHNDELRRWLSDVTSSSER